MARRLNVLTAVLMAFALGSAQASVYRACLQASSGGQTWYYDLRTDQADEAQGTTLDRWIVNGAATYVDRNRYAAFHEPAAGTTTWDQGVAFAAAMQTRNAWLNTEPTSAAWWVSAPSNGEVIWTFRTTVAGKAQDYIFRTSQCRDLSPTAAPGTDVPTEPQEPDTDAPGSQCVPFGGTASVECDSDEACCGSNTMNPHCVSKTNGDKCCVWYKAATTCSSTQSCCGALGPGASSYAFCCNHGTECCQAQVGYSGTATCCAEGTKCCSASTVGLCCAMDEECDVAGNRCIAGSQQPGTNAPATDVPTEPQAPDTPAPTTGRTLHACLQASSRGFTYYYEITSDPANDVSGTTFSRYLVNGGSKSFVDSNTFAALRKPDLGLSWQQGIQFTDAMQSRGVWINTEPTTSATIEQDAVSGEARLIFKTTVAGKPQDYIFRTNQCH